MTDPGEAGAVPGRALARGAALRPRLLPLLLLLAGCGPTESGVPLVGTVERTLVELVAPVAERIEAVEVERGDHVEAGRTLVRLDATLARAELARAEAAEASARSSLRVAAHELARQRRLRRENVASERSLERAVLEHDEAAARLRETRANVDVARKHLDELRVEAPTAGTVDQLPFDPGERPPAGGVVAVLLSDAPPWVRVWVPEPSVARVRPGTPAEVRVDGVGRALRGRVEHVAREPEFTPHFALTERDRVHLVYRARVRLLDAPDGLRPGVPAEVVLRPQPPPEPAPEGPP